ncbi:MAG: quinol:cytochrome C oxidoreductase [Candidatus Cyclobacteriaceae bacterium M2_1C_046]
MISVTEERYNFTSGTRKSIIIAGVVGLVLIILGAIFSGGGHHEANGDGHAVNSEVVSNNLLASADQEQEAVVPAQEEAHEDEAHHGVATWLKRIFTNLWINNIYFVGFGIIGLFFIAIQYAAQAGWSAGMLRVPLAMSYWIPVSGILTIILWFVVKGELFHWTHADAVLEDAILLGKAGYFYWPLTESLSFPIFYLVRMVIFFGLWWLFFVWIKKQMLAEDLDADVKHWYKTRKLSAIFLVIFAVTSSIAAWDWVMSVDSHWFSTMFGWYMFASWWVAGLAFIALVVVLLKEAGYLAVVNSNHLHDIGKFIFGFSIFWTYIWFSQFMLIYYANIPEETVYFIERLSVQPYASIFFINLILNFLLPFLLLMTRDAKRHMSFMKLVCPIIIVGHWFDFYLMITPGVMQFNGGLGLIEIGTFLVFGAAFLLVVLSSLQKFPLFGKNHPMLQESLHHHI